MAHILDKIRIYPQFIFTTSSPTVLSLSLAHTKLLIVDFGLIFIFYFFKVESEIQTPVINVQTCLGHGSSKT